MARSVNGEDSPYAEAVRRDKPLVYMPFEDLDESDDKTIRDLAGKHHSQIGGKLVAADGVPGIPQ